MKRKNILRLLHSYKTDDALEKSMVQVAIRFIERNPNCFDRELLSGHVTGSAWILNPQKTHAILIHHFKLDKWFQPGGHCDGDPDVLQVALKEAQEETGVPIRTASENIFDVDIHIIPARGDVPEHPHYDIRFLFEADKDVGVLGSNSEVKEIRWVDLPYIASFNDSESILRMVAKSIDMKEKPHSEAGFSN